MPANPQLDPTPAERKLFGDLAEDVAYLRRGCGHIVAPFQGRYRVGVSVVNEQGLRDRATKERDLRDRRAMQPPKPPKAAPIEVPPPPAPVVLPTTPPELTGAAVPARTKAPHSTDLGTRPRVVWLDLGLLVIDRRYQRDLTDAGFTHINRIAREWNWNCYQPLIVTENADGTYAVIDGQHRLEAAKKHPLISELPCYIIDAPDVGSQASIFVAVNTNRKALTSQQKFWASHAAGDAAALAFAAICDEFHIKILRGAPGGSIQPRTILGPLICQRLVAKLGKDAVREAIRLLAETHGASAQAFRTSVIAAVARVAATKPFSVNRLRKVLTATDLPNLLAEASTHAVGGGGGSLMLGAEKLLRQRYDAMKPRAQA